LRKKKKNVLLAPFSSGFSSNLYKNVSEKINTKQEKPRNVQEESKISKSENKNELSKMKDQDSNNGKETYKDNTNIGKIFSILGLFKFYRTRVKSSNQYYMFCIHEGGFYKSQKKTENEK